MPLFYQSIRYKSLWPLKVYTVISYVAMLATVIACFTGRVGNQSMPQTFDKWNTYLTPLSWAHSIWIFIWVLQGLYILSICVPSRREDKEPLMRSLGFLLPMSWNTMTIWPVCWVHDQIVAAFIFIFLTQILSFFVYMNIHETYEDRRDRYVMGVLTVDGHYRSFTLEEKLYAFFDWFVTLAPASITISYLGLICLVLSSSIGSYYNSSFDPTLSLALLVLIAIVAITICIHRKDPFVAMPMSIGLAAISVSHTDDRVSLTATVMSISVGTICLMTTGYLVWRLRESRKNSEQQRLLQIHRDLAVRKILPSRSITESSVRVIKGREIKGRDMRIVRIDRDHRADEIEEVLGFNNRIFREETGRDDAGSSYDSIDVWMDRLKADWARIYCARGDDEGRVCAFLFAHTKDHLLPGADAKSKTVHIWLCASSPEVRRQGVMTQLLSALLEDAAAVQVNQLTVCTIPPTFRNMVRWLERNSFTCLGVVDASIQKFMYSRSI
ncbi:hypothetical protein PROFUN_11837 [Planoprotostelium fungivorum]|uniref:N-acetyltransferase domain-containing protein n=1 Tax=Planoprotostelium fungivorum TaxID=1890364 RepID=A0A2P6N994_9EUKA|nr:hypothetical protein PROFUN_11837 [Planoprotostelium fungivorum]